MGEPQMELALIVPDKLNAVEVFTGPQGVEKILSDIEAKVADFVPDTTTAKGRKEIASMAYKVSQSKVLLDELGKNLVADWKAKSALVDASRKVARDRLDALRDKTREPLTRWEEAEAARIAAEKLAREIGEAHAAAIIENDLFNRARELAAREAELARIEAERIAKEEEERKAKEAAEAAARAEEERKANEERIRREVEEMAKRQAEEAAAAAIREAERREREAREAAEQVEREAREAALRAEAEKAAAVKAAQEGARLEAERKERERAAAEDAARRQAEAERRESERKAADMEHRRSVNREVLAGLVAAGLDDTSAKAVITAIVGGMVPHTSVNY